MTRGALTQRLLALLLALCTLNACSAAPPKRLGAPIEGYNHTSAAINHFSVNGSGGPNVSPHNGGGKQNCCASLPVHWTPGLKVLVEWEKDPDPGANKYWPDQSHWEERQKAIAEHISHYSRHRAIVEVAPYDDLGVVSVHFLPCDQIKVAAGTTRPNLPNHPYHYPLNMEEPSTCPTP